MVIILNSDSTGLEGKAYRHLLHFYYIKANYQNTWCEMFKTKGYKKSELYANKVLLRYKRTIERLIKEKYGIEHFYYSAPRSIGSNKLIDVQNKTRQEYLIEITPKQVT